MWFYICLIFKNLPTLLSDIVATRFLFIASFAIDVVDQFVIGNPESSGFSSAILTILTISSGANVAGVPERYSSLKISIIIFVISFSLTFFSSASFNFNTFSFHRFRHFLTIPLSISSFREILLLS